MSTKLFEGMSLRRPVLFGRTCRIKLTENSCPEKAISEKKKKRDSLYNRLKSHHKIWSNKKEERR